MDLDATHLLTFLSGCAAIYMFFWQQGRARKEDETKVFDTIHGENEKQNKESEKDNDQQHKRHNATQEDLKKIQYKDGYNDGYRDGLEAGKSEVREQHAMMMKVLT